MAQINVPAQWEQAFQLAFAGDAVKWFEGLQPPAQAGVLAGCAAVLAAVITAASTATNVLLKDALDRRAAGAKARDLRRELYRKYADPLTSAAESVLWRLREIFEVGRSDYLKPGGGLTRFESYKADSTRYRLAALLGWMRALQRELVLCDAQEDPSVDPMRTALAEVQATLAQGEHVERMRAERLANLWDLGDVDLGRVGRLVDPVVDRFLHARGFDSVEALSAGQRTELAHEVWRAVGPSQGDPHRSGAAIEAAKDDVVDALAVRQAWLYRDWQAAIGDSMLVETQAGARRFDVKGYGEYQLARTSSTVDEPWFEQLKQLTEGVNVEAASRDSRVAQLQAVLQALATLILRFHEAEPKYSSLSPAVLKAAGATLAAAGPAPSRRQRLAGLRRFTRAGSRPPAATK